MWNGEGFRVVGTRARIRIEQELEWGHSRVYTGFKTDIIFEYPDPYSNTGYQQFAIPVSRKPEILPPFLKNTQIKFCQ